MFKKNIRCQYHHLSQSKSTTRHAFTHTALGLACVSLRSNVVERFTQTSIELFHTQLASVISTRPSYKLDIEVNASDSQKLFLPPNLLDEKKTTRQLPKHSCRWPGGGGMRSKKKPCVLQTILDKLCLKMLNSCHGFY